MKKNNKAPLLDVKNLSVDFVSMDASGGKSRVQAVKGISFSLARRETLALVGESGSGKSVSALSILKLLPYPTASHPSGEILFEGDDILRLGDTVLRTIRGRRISMIFQEPMTSLNPLHTIGKQLQEAILLHQRLSSAALKQRIDELLVMVGLETLRNRLGAFPHELSGGQRQRVMIAMALANDPEILIADEPTTALDVTIQAQIMQLLADLKKRLNMSVILITHDLTIVKNVADRVAVMQRGEIVEQGSVTQVFKRPKHPYTKKLLDAQPKGSAVRVKGKPSPLISIEKVNVSYPVKKGFFGNVTQSIKAVDDVSVVISRGQTLGIVGESGCGKTSLAFAVLRLVKPQGKILCSGRNLAELDAEAMRGLRRDLQVVFQDPFSSLNPRMTIADIIGEGLKAHNLARDKSDMKLQIDRVLMDVGLDPMYANRYPHEFSGGQRQRIGVARALVLKPSFIVLDEPTSALDVSTQSDIIDLLKKLQQEYNLTYMFISHDLRVVKAISHHVLVMKDGKIVERGTAAQIFSKPKTAYTRKLVKAAFHVKVA